jgi:putative intracellular protease/amidase
MFDLATDQTSQALIREFVDAGKVVAAVCHGPAALVNVRDEKGESWLKGKRVTGFSNAEEKEVGLDSVVPFLLENRLREAVGDGGRYEKAEGLWEGKVVVDLDGALITGQNPASAGGVAEAILLKVLRGRIGNQ